jgi:hypothetical protein
MKANPMESLPSIAIHSQGSEDPQQQSRTSRSQLLVWWPESTQTRRPLETCHLWPRALGDKFRSVTRNHLLFFSSLRVLLIGNALTPCLISRLKLSFFSSLWNLLYYGTQGSLSFIIISSHPYSCHRTLILEKTFTHASPNRRVSVYVERSRVHSFP